MVERPEENRDTLLTTEDMTKIFPVSKEVIIDYIKSGGLQGFQIKRRYYVLRSTFFAWLETKRVHHQDENEDSRPLPKETTQHAPHSH